MIHVFRETGLNLTGHSLYQQYHVSCDHGTFKGVPVILAPGPLQPYQIQTESTVTVQLVEDLKDRARTALGVAGKCIAQKLFRIQLWSSEALLYHKKANGRK